MIVTVATYRLTTGDTTQDILVSARLEDAQERLEEALDRPLEAISRTEVLIPQRDGSLAPRAVPLQSVADNWLIDGDLLIQRYPSAFGAAWWYPALGPTVTYVGGWVERTANPTAANRLPTCISDDICWTAYRLLHPIDPAATVSILPGATSVTLGDASVSFGPRGAPVPGGRGYSPVRWSAATLRWRYRGGSVDERRAPCY